MSFSIDIVDAHHHFWEPGKNYHPWLCDEPPIAFRYGDYRTLKRPYLPAHYLTDAVGFRVVGSVYIETEWAPGMATQELPYVDSLRGQSGLPSVAAAQIWLDQDDIDAQIEALARFDFVRGVRHKPRANPDPASTQPGGMTCPRWRGGFAKLAHAGLRFELQTPWWHFPEAAQLARDFPEVRIMVNHAGLPGDRSPQAVESWAKAMHEIAQCDNVNVKISGLGTRGGVWDAESNREIVLRAIDLFGINRCMFASNFPVDSLCASFGEIYSAFWSATADLTLPEKSALFADNAKRLYDIKI